MACSPRPAAPAQRSSTCPWRTTARSKQGPARSAWAAVGSSAASFRTVGEDALLRFAGGSFNLGDGASLAGRVELAANTTITVAGTVTTAADSVVTQSGGTFAGAGTLSVLGSMLWSGGTQTDAGTTRIEAGATLVVSGGLTKGLSGGRTLWNEGAVSWSAGQLSLGGGAVIENVGRFEALDDSTISSSGSPEPQFRNRGLFAKTGGTGTTSFNLTLENDGTAQAEVGTLRLTRVVKNEGTLRARSGTVDVQGLLVNYDAATHTLAGGTYDIAGTLRFPGADVVTNAATIVLDGPGSSIIDLAGASALRRIAENSDAGALTVTNGRTLVTPVTFVNRGALTIGVDSAFTSTGTYDQADGATTLATATSALTATAASVNVTGGTLGGVGTVGPVVSATGGEIAPGLSAGRLSASGRYTQGGSAVLHVEIGGHAAVVEFDRLDVGGAATLGGAVRVDTVGDFVPTEGDRFRILAAAERSGEFVSLIGADIGGSLAYTAEYDDTGVTLVVSDLSLSIGDAEVAEGNSGTTPASFAVTLSTPQPVPVTVHYATADGTALASNDYAAASGILTSSRARSRRRSPSRSRETHSASSTKRSSSTSPTPRTR